MFFIVLLTFIICLLISFAFVLLMVVVFLTKDKYPVITRSKKEECFLDPSSKQSIKFPSIKDESSVTLSVIIPAYNESLRLPPMLEECLGYLEKRKAEQPEFSYELIIIDDGSKDETTKVGLEYSKSYGTDKIRVLTLENNRGKGGAVRLGMLSSRGQKLLLADGDGATKFQDIEKLEEAFQQETNPVVIGSRAHLEEESIAKRSVIRTFLMKGFHLVVWLFGVRGFKDTQCGFKLFSRKAAQKIFTSLHVERWAFDVELLYIAQQLNMGIAEIAVNWTEIEGSKLIPIFSWLQMAKDLFMIWLKYRVGAWQIASKSQ